MTTRIAIIGAGPAGTSLALSLLELGVDPRDVVLLDQAQFPRPKLCGGAMTYAGTKLLSQLMPNPLTNRIVTPALRFVSRQGEFTLREPGPQWLYDRSELDHSLLSRCLAAGVEFRGGDKLTSLELRHDTWHVSTSKWKEPFSWVVGADGAHGGSRRAARLPSGRLGRLMEGVFEGSTDCPRELRFDFAPLYDGIAGYAWVFPQLGERRHFKVGIMDARGNVPGAVLKKWLLTFAERQSLKLVHPIAGWPEHYFAPMRLAHQRRFVLTGEALGIDPLLGEGIGPSMAISRYAAKRLKRALDRGDDTCTAYAAGLLATEVGQSLSWQTLLSSWIYGPNPGRWLRILFNRPLKTLAATGLVSYGTMNRAMPILGACLTYEVARYRGLPPTSLEG